jgi:hypothetical protein
MIENPKTSQTGDEALHIYVLGDADYITSNPCLLMSFFLA